MKSNHVRHAGRLQTAIVSLLCMSFLALMFVVSRLISGQGPPGLNSFKVTAAAKADIVHTGESLTSIDTGAGLAALRMEAARLAGELSECKKGKTLRPRKRIEPADTWDPPSVSRSDTDGAKDGQGQLQADPALPSIEPSSRVSVASVATPSMPLLLLGIPTVRRSGEPDYLIRTLGYIHEGAASKEGRLEGRVDSGGSGEAPGPHKMRVRAVIMDNSHDGGTHSHTVFETAVDKYCGPAVDRVRLKGSAGLDDQEGAQGGLRPLVPPPQARAEQCFSFTHGAHEVMFSPASMFVFATNGHPVADEGSEEGTPNFPGSRVRRQSRDVVDLLSLVHDLFGSAPPTIEGGREGWERTMLGPRSAHYPEPEDGLLSSFLPLVSPLHPLRTSLYSFMEDDFRLCPSGLAALALLHARAQAEVGEWNAARWSLGLAGGTIRGYDVTVFRDYLKEHLARRPPDHLFVEWFAGERPQSADAKGGRKHVAFRYNLLEHFGYSSSLRTQVSPVYAFCYDDMNEGVVFEVEAFKPRECEHDIVWPCLSRDSALYSEGSLPSMDHVDFQGLRARARTDTVQTWTLNGGQYNKG